LIIQNVDKFQIRNPTVVRHVPALFLVVCMCELQRKPQPFANLQGAAIPNLSLRAALWRSSPLAGKEIASAGEHRLAMTR
jgi:hypothetical protein